MHDVALPARALASLVQLLRRGSFTRSSLLHNNILGMYTEYYLNIMYLLLIFVVVRWTNLSRSCRTCPKVIPSACSFNETVLRPIVSTRIHIIYNKYISKSMTSLHIYRNK